VRWPWSDDVPPRTRRAVPPRAVVVGGVSGSGKTTVGRALADRLGWSYVEADDHHSPENKAKMARGEPLDDADRAPWLASLRRALEDRLERGDPVVMTCSALKRSYRDTLTDGLDDVAVVLLHASERVIAQRLAGRGAHFFGPALLRSQLDTLELPAPDEDALVVDVRADEGAVLERIVDALDLGRGTRSPRPPEGAT
jgi:gluconokinase